MFKLLPLADSVTEL